MNVFLVVLLVLAGVALLLMEMFLLPGFGIAGISGFGFLVAAIVLAWLWISKVAGLITLGACLLLSGLAIWGFVSSDALRKLIVMWSWQTINSRKKKPRKKRRKLQSPKHQGKLKIKKQNKLWMF